MTNVYEKVLWLECATYSTELCLNYKKTSIRNGRKRCQHESKFCDSNVIDQILRLKSSLSDFAQTEYFYARSVCNDYESIGRSIFQNRSAVKIANLDAILNFMFTNPEILRTRSKSTDNTLYFADICSGPGGFSQYVMWRTKLNAKGFGCTLRNELDFNLNHIPGNFDIFYGTQGDGNILNPANIESLKDYILMRTGQMGVHFLMADGGITIKNENMQEYGSKNLYICQCLTALLLVREGGDCIVKLYDIFSLFSVGLVYLMYRCFKQILIIKPNSSRPANSERYLICKHKNGNTTSIEKYLFIVNEKLWMDSDIDIIELVPYKTLNGDQNFMKYIFESNTTIARNQIASISKIINFIKTKRKQTEKERIRQENIRMICLRDWNLPGAVRMVNYYLRKNR